MFRQLRPIAVGRPDLADRDALQEAFAEVLSDLNQIATAWNDSIYPLLGTLPLASPERRVGADRNGSIEPIINGLDGSQVFMDMTTTPEANANFLYNLDQNRPKTIKEVVLDSHSALTSEMQRVTNLINQLEINVAAYDDTEVKNWIRRVAANTWDEDEIAAGIDFDIANFGADPGAPTKSVTYSLNQRNTNLRHIAGVEGLGFEIQTPITLFATGNYIDDANDFVDALLQLDAEIFGLGGAVDLQDAYDNGRTITLPGSAVPVVIAGSDSDDQGLDLTGTFRMTYDDGFVSAANMQMKADYVAGGSDRSRLIFEGTPGTMTEFITFERYDAATPEAKVSIAKRTSDINEELGILEIGRETSGEGGEPHATLKSHKKTLVTAGRLEAPEHLDLIAGDTVMVIGQSNVTLHGDSGLVLSSDNGVVAFSHSSGDNVDGDPTLVTMGAVRSEAANLSDDSWQSVAGESQGGILDMGGFKATGWAPTVKSGADYGDDIGVPEIFTLYRNNVIKSKGKFLVDGTGGLKVDVGVGDTYDAYNIDIDGGNTEVDPTQSTIKVTFLAAMDDDDYTLVCGYGGTTQIMNFRISAQTVNDFIVIPYKWDSGTNDWIPFDDTVTAFDFHFTVV